MVQFAIIAISKKFFSTQVAFSSQISEWDSNRALARSSKLAALALLGPKKGCALTRARDFGFFKQKNKLPPLHNIIFILDQLTQVSEGSIFCTMQW